MTGPGHSPKPAVLGYRLVLATLSADHDAFDTAMDELWCVGCTRDVVAALVSALSGALVLLADNKPPLPPATAAECRQRAAADVESALAMLLDPDSPPC